MGQVVVLAVAVVVGLYGQEHPGVNERCEKNSQRLRRWGKGSMGADTHTLSPQRKLEKIVRPMRAGSTCWL